MFYATAIPTAATPRHFVDVHSVGGAGNSEITRYVPRIANDVSPNLGKCIETQTMRRAGRTGEGWWWDGWSVSPGEIPMWVGFRHTPLYQADKIKLEIADVVESA